MEVLVAVLILIHFSTMNVMDATNISRPLVPFTYGEVENSGNENESFVGPMPGTAYNWEIEPVFQNIFIYIDATLPPDATLPAGPLPTEEIPLEAEFMMINWGFEIVNPEIFNNPEIFHNSGRPDNYFSPVVAVSYSGNETVANATKTTAVYLKNATVVHLTNTTEVYLTNTTEVYLTNTTVVNQTVLVVEYLCRTLVFCEHSAFNICKKTKLNNCQHCSVWKYAASATVVTLLGLFIVIGNSAVIWSVWKKKKEEKSISQLLKTSLAVADVCSGIYLFGSFLPNIIWTANHTFNELKTSLIELRGTTQTSIIGILFLLIFLSNLYQLTAYCLIRLYVTVYPFTTQSFTTNFSIKLILGVWILAFISATLPLWFPTVFAFTYQHDYFIYWFEVLPNQASLLYLTALFLYVSIPYFVMTMSTLITLIVVRQKLNKSRQLSLKQDAIDKKERIVTKNVAIMILGFTVTTVPFIAVTGLVNSKLIKCGANTNAPTFTFYMFYSRSIINVLVYIATDKKFRQSLFRRSDHNTSATKNTKSVSI